MSFRLHVTPRGAGLMSVNGLHSETRVCCPQSRDPALPGSGDLGLLLAARNGQAAPVPTCTPPALSECRLTPRAVLDAGNARGSWPFPEPRAGRRRRRRVRLRAPCWEQPPACVGDGGQRAAAPMGAGLPSCCSSSSLHSQEGPSLSPPPSSPASAPPAPVLFCSQSYTVYAPVHRSSNPGAAAIKTQPCCRVAGKLPGLFWSDKRGEESWSV